MVKRLFASLWTGGISGLLGASAFHPRLGYSRFMQVSLTPQAEQLLRDAMARNPGSTAAEILEEALAERRKSGAASDSLRERLKSLPGVKMPAHWPPQFEPVEPLQVEGELPSERLVRERR